MIATPILEASTLTGLTAYPSRRNRGGRITPRSNPKRERGTEERREQSEEAEGRFGGEGAKEARANVASVSGPESPGKSPEEDCKTLAPPGVEGGAKKRSDDVRPRLWFELELGTDAKR
ncbi:hypothetical protein MRX96_024447 [Rhipicephalus microplus]